MGEIPSAALKAFDCQRRSSKRRGILFLFSFAEWWAWWSTDDRWDRRGRTRDALVMGRKGDVGPYSPDNVVCITQQENLQQVSRKTMRIAAEKAARTRKARGIPFGLHLRVRGDGHPKSKAVVTPLGRFGSAALAAEAFGLHPSEATRKARKRLAGWRYEAADCGASS